MVRFSFSSVGRCAVTLALSLPALVTAATVRSNVLIIARDSTTANNAASGLVGYGIPYELLAVPQSGVALPSLNSSGTAGNFGAIVIIGEVSYDYGGTFRSALTDAQFNDLYNYQTTFGVRMVRLDVYPNANNHGAEALGGISADNGVWISNTDAYGTAGLKTGKGATMSTTGLYFYPARIVNTTTTSEIARFGAGGGFQEATAAVINNFGGRQQQVWFLPFATEWSATSNLLQHAWIQWATRGLYSGFRRTYFSTQIDDVFLATGLYKPAGVNFRVRPGDMDAHRDWIPQINAKMPAGSSYFPEIGHNGNGDIEAAIAADTAQTQCNPREAIYYPEQIDTPLEFQKPLGTGQDIWPATPARYTWSLNCAKLDTLEQWFAVPANRDAFGHLSHTFSHMSLNNATYADARREITFNQAWMRQVGISSAKRFSLGLIPPAITGLHNGDVIRAWMENGIKYVVGDNTRAPLRNSNTFWPVTSTVASNGYDGLIIMPRWATTIYYNCDTPDCTFSEWRDTSAGTGDFQNLLRDARNVNARNLLGLHWDSFMFHQANLRYTDMPSTEVNGVSQKLSLLQIWVETIVNEMTRIVSWPMVTIKHDDLAIQFVNREKRDKCSPNITWNTSTDGKTITGATVTANGNTCSVPIPVTFPGEVTNTDGATREKLGNDPLTLWVTLNGQARTYTLRTPLAV